MPEATDDPTPLPATGAEPAPSARTRRTRKFTLPEHHHEEVVGDRIEAFLEGPATPRRRPQGRRSPRVRPFVFDDAAAWPTVVRHEAARQSRYGRPLVIVAIEVAAPADGTPDPMARRRLAEVVGREVRETDRATWDAPSRVLILLPETGEEEAHHLVARIDRGYRLLADDGPVRLLSIDVALPRRGTDPLSVVDDLRRRLSAEAAG